MNTAGPESDEPAQPPRTRKPLWRTICDIVHVLAIAYFAFLVLAILIAPAGTGNWAVFALHFVVTIIAGYGAKWFVDRYDERQAGLAERGRVRAKRCFRP